MSPLGFALAMALAAVTLAACVWVILAYRADVRAERDMAATDSSESVEATELETQARLGLNDPGPSVGIPQRLPPGDPEGTDTIRTLSDPAVHKSPGPVHGRESDDPDTRAAIADWVESLRDVS